MLCPSSAAEALETLEARQHPLPRIESIFVLVSLGGGGSRGLKEGAVQRGGCDISGCFRLVEQALGVCHRRTPSLRRIHQHLHRQHPCVVIRLQLQRPHAPQHPFHIRLPCNTPLRTPHRRAQAQLKATHVLLAY
jgi:hypothetical protein